MKIARMYAKSFLTFINHTRVSTSPHSGVMMRDALTISTTISHAAATLTALNGISASAATPFKRLMMSDDCRARRVFCRFLRLAASVGVKGIWGIEFKKCAKMIVRCFVQIGCFDCADLNACVCINVLGGWGKIHAGKPEN